MSDIETRRRKIDAYLLENLSAELDALNRYPIDRYSKWLYVRALEFYWTSSRALRNLRDAVDRLRGVTRNEPPNDLNGEIREPTQRPRLLIDMTPTVRSGAKTGIQRVVREIARECALQGLGVPITIQDDGSFRRRYSVPGLAEEIEPEQGDILLLLDAAWNEAPLYPPAMRRMKEKGGTNVVAVYDILPLLHPPLFNCKVGADFARWFEEIVRNADAAIAISRATAESVVDYLGAGPSAKPLPVGWWRLGADFAKAARGAPSAKARRIAEGAPYFLSVGTLEPRKAYPTALGAFERLWAKGCEIGYTIVGRPGWNTTALQERLLGHPEAGRRLNWLDQASDADLHLLYAQARGTVNASVAEGFGLPVVEAAMHGVPVIASDIPIFREVGGTGARYFELLDSESLAAAIESTLAEPRRAPSIQTIGWHQSAQEMVRVIRQGDYPLRGA
jgi:alpha-1,2-rhamnosyltransferase